MADTLIDVLVEAAEVPGLGVCFWEKPGKSEHVTYAQFLEDARIVAHGLTDKGLKPGERVALILPTEPDFYRAFFGVILAGGVPTSLYPPLRLGRVDEWKERTSKILISTKSVALITTASLVGICGEPVTCANPRLGTTTVSALLSGGQLQGLMPADKEALAVVQVSSGSTGDPKPVALTHDNMVSNAKAIVDSLPGNWDEHSCVSWLPLYHDMGLIGCMISAMVAHCPLTLLRPERFVTRPKLWLQAISETKATISVAPNFAFGLATNRIKDQDIEDVDLSSWKVALCGAEPVHRNTLDKFAERFQAQGFRAEALTPVYGLAEATLAVTFSPVEDRPVYRRFDQEMLLEEGRAVPDDTGRDLASVGKPLPGVQVEVRSNDDCVLNDGRVGNVWVQSSGVMKGYLDRPDATAAALDVNGWLNTGDTGFIYDGELHLCGRSKDLIIINGRNHDPSLIEDALHDFEGIRSGCVSAFAIPDEKSDTEGLGIVAETRLDDSDQVATLEEQVRTRVQTETGLRVSYLRLTKPGTLPRTSSGKIRRQETRKRVLSGTLTGPGQAGRVVYLRETVRGFWRRATSQLKTKQTA